MMSTYVAWGTGLPVQLQVEQLDAVPLEEGLPAPRVQVERVGQFQVAQVRHDQLRGPGADGDHDLRRSDVHVELHALPVLVHLLDLTSAEKDRTNIMRIRTFI